MSIDAEYGPVIQRYQDLVSQMSLQAPPLNSVALSEEQVAEHSLGQGEKRGVVLHSSRPSSGNSPTTAC